MAQKRNFSTLVIVIMVIAIAILSFTVAQSGNGQITLPGGASASTPTIVAPQSKPLTWDCPGAASCGGGG